MAASARAGSRGALRLRGGARALRTLARSLAGWAGVTRGGGEDRAREAAWLQHRAAERLAKYRDLPEPGLLSFITPVWNTTPEYLVELANSIFAQAGDPSYEWVVLDNGSTDAGTLAVLDQTIAPHPKVALYRSAENLGIIAGSRYCLERATGRYVVLVDHDDRLYPDCAATVAHWLRRCDSPAAMYSDEDKLVGGVAAMPFLKPDWDPVLFANQAYTAHLDVVDRQTALDVGAFTDRAAEGSPDWDCLMRLHVAGHDPVHLPEVLYSWRMHPASTALNIDSKSYIHSSQQAVVERYRQHLPEPERFALELSPLFPGTPDWRLRRLQEAPPPAVLVVIGEDGPGSGVQAFHEYPVPAPIHVPRETPPGALLGGLPAGLPDEALVALLDARVAVTEPGWLWEALGLMERYPDTGVVGGRLLDEDDRVVAAGQVLGFEPACGCPDAGRPSTDPGYSVWLLKQRSVSAVSAAQCIFTAGFLRDLLRHGCPPGATWAGLGEWAGAHALRTGARVVYSPFVAGRTQRGPAYAADEDERRLFLATHGDVLPCERWYAPGFGLTLATNYRPVEAEERATGRADARYAGGSRSEGPA